MNATALFVSIFIKFFFLLTPFFVMTMFLTLTADMDRREQRRIALRVTFAVSVIAMVLLFFGNAIFNVFGITLDAFRIGAGALLFLSSVDLVRSSRSDKIVAEGDISVVPLAIPIAVGPATTGALLVLGAGLHGTTHKLIGCGALLSAVVCVGALLLASSAMERLIGRQGLIILSKITGLILAGLAAQIVFTGVKNFLGL